MIENGDQSPAPSKGVPLEAAVVYRVLVKCACGALGQPIDITIGGHVQVKCGRCHHKVLLEMDPQQGPLAYDQGVGLSIVHP